MTEKKLIKIAKSELRAWETNHSHPLPPGLVMAVLFCFIHRVTTGETFEQTFFKNKFPEPDYEI